MTIKDIKNNEELLNSFVEDIDDFDEITEVVYEVWAFGYDENDEMNVWFDKIKGIADELGFASDMKLYKANPTAYKGNVADVSMFVRVAVTGKMNAPDLYTVMQILGTDCVKARITDMIEKVH